MPSQWETSLQSNAVFHWLGANLELALLYIPLPSTLNLHQCLHSITPTRYLILLAGHLSWCTHCRCPFVNVMRKTGRSLNRARSRDSNLWPRKTRFGISPCMDTSVYTLKWKDIPQVSWSCLLPFPMKICDMIRSICLSSFAGLVFVHLHSLGKCILAQSLFDFIGAKMIDQQ